MKKLNIILGIIVIGITLMIPMLTTIGCKTTPTQQKIAVNTLFSLHTTVDVALDGYLDLVNKHLLVTNSVSKVLNAYLTFQSVYNGAVVFVANNTNAVAPQNLVDETSTFIKTVDLARKGGL